MSRAKLTERQQFDALDLMGGDMNDRQIGDKFGVTAQVIGRLRRRNGIASVPFVAPKFEPAEHHLAELIECSNREMSRRHGHEPTTWAKVRKRYGIPNYRPATTINGVPQKWAIKEPRQKADSAPWGAVKPSPIPPRDTSLAGEAASFLRRERFTVFNRAAIGVGEGWQVGHSIYDETGLIAKAKRLGFKQEEWMG